MSWATHLLSEDLWNTLQEALALVDVTTRVMFEALDFNAVIAGIMNSVKAKFFVNLVAAIGFEQLAER